MKVLLVNPPFVTKAQLLPPLGMGYLGASLLREGFEVLFLDAALGKNYQESLGSFKPDVVAITGLSTQYLSMKEYARMAKSKGITTIVGGVHVSAIPEFVLEDCEYIDFAVKGEGEYTLPRLLKAVSPIGIPGVYYRNGSVVGSPPEFITELDSLPHPWDFLDLADYDGNMVNGILKPRGRQSVAVLSSRGCPYLCTFCSASQAQGRKVRLRSIGDWISELRDLVSKGVEEIQVMDDNFTFYSEKAYHMCDAMVKEKLNLSWTLPNGIRADRIDRDLLLKMKESGCYYFGIGVETGSERLLKEMHKELSLEKVRETVKMSSGLGIITQGFLLTGYPTETKEDRVATSKFVRGSRLDRISINAVMPYPGSTLYKTYFTNSEMDWERMHRTTMGMVDPQAKNFARNLYLRFYLDPIRLLRHVSKFRTLAQWRSLFGGLLTLISETNRR